MKNISLTTVLLNHFVLRLVLGLVLGLMLSANLGCGAKRALEPLEPAGFIEWRTDDTISDRTPFTYYWADATNAILEAIRSGGQYELYVALIRRDYLKSKSDSPEALAERGMEVATYFHEKLLAAIKAQNKKSRTVTLVDAPSATSLTLEIALTKLETGNPLAYASGFAAPLPGVATAVDALGTASLAMEGKLYDSATGEPLVEFADLRIPRVRPIDINKFTKTRPLFDIASDWATEIARATVTNVAKDKIEGVSNFSLLPW